VRRRFLVRAVTFAVVTTIGLGGADAHVAPSVDDNNRYLKLTPTGDRVRFAYTVFFGENPGRAQRPSLDTDRDGTIADAEAQAFATRLGAEVAASLEATIDGAPVPVTWSVVSAGLGSPSTRAGAFSVDLVAYLCLPVARGRHEVRVRDRFRVPRPGETEVRVEDGPGIRIERARLGALVADGLDFKLVGPAGPLAEDGVELAFVASDAAPVGADTICHARAAGGRGLPTAVVIAAGALIGGGLALLVAWRRRRAGR